MGGPSSTAGASPAPVAGSHDLQFVYHTTFANGSLESGIDPLAIGSLKLGRTEGAGIDPFWKAFQGDYLIGLTRPANLAGPPIVAGLYATPVEFDVGSVVKLQATFVAPRGPHDTDAVWAVTIAARPGGVEPLVVQPMASVTLQVRGATARLNTPGASSPAGLPNLPPAVYDAIFDPTDPQPFTLEMLIDRKNGRGEAKLKVGDAVFSRTYEFDVFKADSGPPITNVGVNIAIAKAPGHCASVRVRNFKIYSSKRP